jgi:alpha/beta superfamily hydrolase
MSKSFHRTFFLDGPAGRLEALLWTPPHDAGALAALVCHPHPLFGGTMHNKVVYQAAKTLHRLRLPVLRFNFRGAGLSEGRHDEGRGERDDVRAALDFLAREYAGRPLLLAGFSFGASVGLRVGCQDSRVAALVGLGLPVNNTHLDFLHACARPKLFVQGARDEFGSRENVEALFAALPEPKRLVFVEGADHFFAGRLHEVDSALRSWLLEQHAELSATDHR